MKRERSKSPVTQLWCLAVGYLFVAVNLEINGVGILFPTFIGYGLIAGATWSLGERHRVFRYATPLAVILVVTTFPLFLRGMANTVAFMRAVFWPSIVLEAVVIVIVAIGLWYEARGRKLTWLKTASPAAIAVLVGSLVAWWFIPQSSNALRIVSFIIYVIPALYLSGVSAAAARSLS